MSLQQKHVKLIRLSSPASLTEPFIVRTGLEMEIWFRLGTCFLILRSRWIGTTLTLSVPLIQAACSSTRQQRTLAVKVVPKFISETYHGRLFANYEGFPSIISTMTSKQGFHDESKPPSQPPAAQQMASFNCNLLFPSLTYFRGQMHTWLQVKHRLSIDFTEIQRGI